MSEPICLNSYLKREWIIFATLLASSELEVTENFPLWTISVLRNSFCYSELICPYVSLFLLSADELLFSTINILQIFTQLLLASSQRQHWCLVNQCSLAPYKELFLGSLPFQWQHWKHVLSRDPKESGWLGLKAMARSGTEDCSRAWRAFCCLCAASMFPEVIKSSRRRPELGQMSIVESGWLRTLNSFGGCDPCDFEQPTDLL